MPRIAQNTFKRWSKHNEWQNTRSNTASINTVISETSDSKSSPENIETKSSRENIDTRNP